MQRIPAMMTAWGDWWIKHLEGMGHPGINWLYRLIHDRGARPDVIYDTDDNGEVFISRDRILCPEMSKNVRKVQIAVNSLPNIEEKCIAFRYCAPPKDDGNLYTKRELARVLHMSRYAFNNHLARARKKLRKNLTTDV